MSLKSAIKIDDKEYLVENMNDEQKALVQAIKFCDVKTMEVQNELAALKTARQAYVNDLGERLKS